MPTEVIKIVDPDSGAGFDYSSLNAWEAAEQGNLVSADEIAIAKCRTTAGSADTTIIKIVGWDTDITRFVKIWTDPAEAYRHAGVWNTAKFRLETSAVTLEVTENFCLIEGLQLKGTGTVDVISVSADKWGNSIISNIIKGGSNGIQYTRTGTPAVSYFIINNIIYDTAQSGIYLKGTAQPGFIYNNTVFNCNKDDSVNDGGIEIDNNSICTLKNNIAYNNKKEDFKRNPATESDSKNNLSKDTSAFGTNNVQSATLSFVNTTGGSEDFHLVVGDTDAIGAGINLSSDSDFPLTDDIDGDTRSAWDIGADEFISAAADIVFPARLHMVI